MFGKKKKKEEKNAAERAADDIFAEDEKDGVVEESLDDSSTPVGNIATKEFREEHDNVLKELDDQPEWIDQESEEGQLSVDVYQSGNNIIVKSTIAGVEPGDIDISIINDMLTIRGERKKEAADKNREYFFQECYWGGFSRSIILPVEVDVKKIDATIKNGILTVILPSLMTKRKDKNIKVKDGNE